MLLINTDNMQVSCLGNDSTVFPLGKNSALPCNDGLTSAQSWNMATVFNKTATESLHSGKLEKV